MLAGIEQLFGRAHIAEQFLAKHQRLQIVKHLYAELPPSSSFLSLAGRLEFFSAGALDPLRQEASCASRLIHERQCWCAG